MVRVALIGLGKMGISHLSILKAHPQVELVAVCDAMGLLVDTLKRHIGVKGHSDYKTLLREEQLDAVVVATPTRFHAEIVRAALERDVAVFCEKPLSLNPEESAELAAIAAARGLVNQVGYHYRFIGTFGHARMLAAAGAIGALHHIRAEAYGPVVLRPKTGSWRSSKTEGGGCLYDYASHAVDLMNYLVGAPQSVSGTVLNRVFSADVDDEVYATLHYSGGMTGQLAANWSDESLRKMSMKITLWGTAGRIQADRQELQIFCRDAGLAEAHGLRQGWNARYIGELTEEVWFYLRGEEYSAQIDHFVKAVAAGESATESGFATAAEADRVIAALARDAAGTAGAPEAEVAAMAPAPARQRPQRRLLTTLFGARGH